MLNSKSFNENVFGKGKEPAQYLNSLKSLFYLQGYSGYSWEN